MFSRFYREMKRGESADTNRPTGVATLAKETINGLPVVGRYSDGSVEVAGPQRNFLVSADRMKWLPIE